MDLIVAPTSSRPVLNRFYLTTSRVGCVLSFRFVSRSAVQSKKDVSVRHGLHAYVFLTVHGSGGAKRDELARARRLPVTANPGQVRPGQFRSGQGVFQGSALGWVMSGHVIDTAEKE